MTDTGSRKRRIDLGGADPAAGLSSSSKRIHAEKALNPWTGIAFSNRYYSILETRQKLPVYQFKDELVEAVRKNQFVVVEGETGSGKTTQVRTRRWLLAFVVE